MIYVPISTLTLNDSDCLTIARERVGLVLRVIRGAFWTFLLTPKVPGLAGTFLHDQKLAHDSLKSE